MTPPAPSPLPWKADGQHLMAEGITIPIGSATKFVDAAFIVEAVNSHAPLRELVGELRKVLRDLVDAFNAKILIRLEPTAKTKPVLEIMDAIYQANAVLAKAHAEQVSSSPELRRSSEVKK